MSSTVSASSSNIELVSMPITKNTEQVSFAFDIDGVLIRSSSVLPGATETLQKLYKQRTPFIFLTNGGGVTEARKAEELSKKFSIPIDERQVVLSHSPFYDLVPQYKDKSVLVIGGIGNKVRDLAKAYGFNNVFTPADLLASESHIYPFAELTQEHHFSNARIDGPRNADGQIEIAAILMWSSSRDTGLELQLVMDLLLSSQGKVGTISPLNGNSSLPNNGYGQDNQPALYFCNPDLTWASSYALPRYAQGSFKAALEGVWAAHTGGAEMLNVHECGKPTAETYRYGEKALREWNATLNGPDAPELKRVYMVGDNPLSDIAGANAWNSEHGIEWKSILVESGVYEKGTTPAHVPDMIVAGVKDAVEWAFEDAAKPKSEKPLARYELQGFGHVASGHWARPARKNRSVFSRLFSRN